MQCEHRCSESRVTVPLLCGEPVSAPCWPHCGRSRGEQQSWGNALSGLGTETGTELTASPHLPAQHPELSVRGTTGETKGVRTVIKLNQELQETPEITPAAAFPVKAMMP